MNMQAVLPQARGERTTMRFEPASAPGSGTLLVLHPDLDAWAMRAANASGFGGNAMPTVSPRMLPAVAAPVTAPAERPSRPLRRVRALLRLLRRRARHRAELRELESLDAATLRDLGLHRSEIGSIWSERVGLAMASRRPFAEHEHFRLRSGLPLSTHARF